MKPAKNYLLIGIGTILASFIAISSIDTAFSIHKKDTSEDMWPFNHTLQYGDPYVLELLNGMD